MTAISAPKRMPPPVVGQRIMIGVRTHKSDAASVAAFERYSTVPNVFVSFVCDERNNTVDPGGRPKVGWNNDWLTANGLLVHPQCGWRCGDYNYYRLRQAYPDFDTYWLVEPDVLINTSDLPGFFAAFLDDPSDYLCGRFGPRDKHWVWQPEMSPDYPNVYGGLYPITRCSGRAIDFMFTERARLSALVEPSENPRWANDEAFTGSCLMSAGFLCADLSNDYRVVRTTESLRTGVVHDQTIIAALPPDGLIYHPVRPLGTILEKSEFGLRRFRRVDIGGTANRESVHWLSRTARSCLDHPEFAEGALVPLAMMREYADNSPEAQEEGWAGLAVQGRNLFRRHFGPKAGRPAIGSVFSVRPNKLTGPYTGSAVTDFTRGEAEPLAVWPQKFALPFAFDMAEQSLLHTLHMQPQMLLREPALFAAQRERSYAAASVGWRDLPTLHGVPNRAARPIFLFTIGRTTAPLLGDLLRCLTPRCFLEPDALAQLGAQREALTAMPQAQRDQLMWSAIAPFFDTFLGSGVDGPCLIKLRFGANALAGELAALLPQARFVLVLSERRHWALSTFRAFRMTPDAAAGRLQNGIQMAHALKKAGVDLHIARHEDIIAKPQALLTQVMGDMIAHDQPMIVKLDEVIELDAQDPANAERGRGAKPVDNEDIWLARFEARWKLKRPAAALDALGLRF